MLAKPAKRKYYMLEKVNIIAVFSIPEMKGTTEWEEIFKEIARLNLWEARNRYQMAQMDAIKPAGGM